ncbi:MAG: DUF268 domain-containing protein [Deltaproteobacteria bacterium]|nr:DUF268 domain-containing protein [Deltaproteobacteria bacterium]
MKRHTVSLSIDVPSWLYRLLRGLRRRVPLLLNKGVAANLLGDRDIEWSWVASHIPEGPGLCLDFGAGGSMLGLIAAMRGFETTALDLSSPDWDYIDPRLSFVRQDILECTLPEGRFDLIINCSAVEHVGLAGRYDGASSRPDGDLEAMGIMRRLLKPDGKMILTAPVGKDQVFAPYCRVYGRNRLPALLHGYCVQEEAFWVKDAANRWAPCAKETALDFEASAGSGRALSDVYALGCFVLKGGPAQDVNR